METTETDLLETSGFIYIGIEQQENYTTPYSDIMYSEGEAEDFLQNKFSHALGRKVVKIQNPFLKNNK